MKKILTHIIAVPILFAFTLTTFSFLEPTSLSAATANDSVTVSMTVTEQIAISSPADVTMNALNITTNESTGTATWNVKTNASGGYTLAVHGTETDAMQGQGGLAGTDFTDYTAAVAATPEVWSVSNAYEFGFSGYGADILDATWGAGSSWGAGTIPADLKYRGFDAATNITIASDTDETSTAGTDSTVCFAAEQETVFAPAGSYQAVVVATATTQ